MRAPTRRRPLAPESLSVRLGSLKTAAANALDDLRARVVALRRERPRPRGPGQHAYRLAVSVPPSDAVDECAATRRLAIAVQRAQSTLPRWVSDEFRRDTLDSSRASKSRRRSASLMLFVHVACHLDVRDLSALLKLFPWMFSSHDSTDRKDG